MVVLDSLDRIPARLVFTTGVDAFQLLIKSSTRCEATHAAIALGPGGEQLLHAYEEGVKLEPRELWLGEREQRLVAEFQILPDVTDGVFSAMSHLGKRYDVAHVFKIGLMRLLRLAKLGPPEADDKFTCARFVMMIDPVGDTIPEWRDIWRESVVPKDLLDAAERGPSFYRVA